MASPDRFTRREMIRSAAAAPLAAGLFAPRAAGDQDMRPGEDDRPHNIIFMVSDGMSAGVPALAEPFSRLVRSAPTHWNALMADPRAARGFLQADSLSSLVTDSAAASTAWASGSLVFNGSLNVLPDGTRLTPIARLAVEKGKAIGLVSTTTITHATPAGFAAVQPKRADQHLVALDYLNLVDVALGGGRDYFDSAKRSDRRDAYADFANAGYRVCRTKDELLASGDARRLLGVFSDGHMPYTIDQRNRPAEHVDVPTLAEMTHAALALLERKPGGFLLQVEGGRVDHAAHANDAAATLWDQLAFDDALGAALAFAAQRDDTLIIVTTDHGNANPGLNGMGVGYRDSTTCFARLAAATASYDRMGKEMRAAVPAGEHASADDVIDVLHAHTGITLSAIEAAAVARTLAGEKTDDLNPQHRGVIGALGQSLGNHTGIAWTGTSHTADLSPMVAIGPGALSCAGLLHHADLNRVLLKLWEIDHVNPSMSPDAARRYLSMHETDDIDAHWA